MSNEETLSFKQKQAIEELERHLKNSVTTAFAKDTRIYYKFLKARDFDVDAAEKMLRNSIVWRKINQVDTLLEDFTPREFFTKYTHTNLIGYDKEGNMVRYAASGYSAFEIFKATKMSNFLKHWYWFAEETVALLRAENERIGKNGYQIILIFDLEQATISNLMNKKIIELILNFITISQDNFPECLKSAYFINVPAFFVVTFSIMKAVMSNVTQNKFHVFGRSGYQEILPQFIDPDVLPAFLGGNRTDPDGNPKCHSFILHDCRIPECYFLTDEERFFKDRSKVQERTIPAGEKIEIPKVVKELGTKLEWEFLVKGKDIGFGLFLEKTESEAIEIIPIEKYKTPDGTEADFHKCRETGKYVFIFDNTYSWRSNKNLEYCITVVPPNQ